MASITEPQPPPLPAEESPRAEERLVDAQIKQTRRALKMVDLTAGMITLVIGVIMFLLTAAVLEHWVIPGGWSSTARTTLFVLLVLGAAWYGLRVIWPLLRQPINAAYAAQAIEQSSPAMKNSLLNFLLLRNRKRLISRQVYQAIEHQAAQGLSKVSLDSAIDRSAILRLGSVLLVVIAVCAFYLLLSPKDLMSSASRVLLPWREIAVPSRVQLYDIRPGDTQAARGDQIEVSAEVSGLSEDEPVRLLYSTADEQIVGQEIRMTAGVGGIRFEAKLPGRMSEGGGVQQDFNYWIEAGDARSERFEVTVFARPTLVVQNVRYNYPDYTGYPSREEAHTGDLSAVEGTVVTITAISNQPIKSGHLDFEADGRHDLLMKFDDQQATISFPLELREDRRTPRYQSYMLRYTTTEGRKNKLPPKYRIDVTPDYSPEIRLLAPEEEVVDVLIDEQVTIEVEARDPDFAVQRVAILGEVGGEQVLKQSLLSENHTGRFVGRMELTPSKLGLKVGDVLQYWGAAADNRRPEANLAFTNRRKIRVVGPGEDGEGKSDEQGDDGEGDSQAGEGEGDGEQNESGENGEGESGESGGEGENEGEGQQGPGQSGAGEDGEGMSDEQDQQQGGEGQAGESNEENQDSQANSDGQAGGDSEGDRQQENESTQNDGGESEGDSSAEPGGSDKQKVSPDGDDDGTAFERIAEHLDEQQEGESDSSEMNEQEGGEGQQQRESDGDAADGKADRDQSDHGEGAENAEASEQSNSAEDDAQKPSQSEDDSGAEGDPAAQQEESDSSEGEEPAAQEQGPDGKMSPEQGPSGAGEQPGDQQGTPEPQGDKAPQDRPGDQAAGDEKDDQEAPSQGEGQKESDSEGSQGGDRSGGGQEGAGQQADAEGKGGAGQHQAADEGGGKSDQPGEGEMSDKPGGENQAEGETGESNQNQPGGGSKQGDQSGEQAGGENQGEKGEEQPGNGQPQQGSSGEDSPNEGQPQEASKGEDPSSPAGQDPSSGGQSGKSAPPPSGETQPGDEANLDYARKQTDLVLEKLDDQLKKNEADEKLLDKLGWSKDELRRFVDRWKHLKQQAAGEGKDADGARQQLDDALRSLGLGRNRRTGFHSQTAKDKLRELQDSYRGKTPLEYQQRVRAYIKGTAAAEEK